MQQQRILEIPGGHNFRDLGGYVTEDGRTVKWGTLYRSGLMSRIDAQDVEALHRLGIVSICDFRTNSERRRRPTTWHEGQPVEMKVHDYEMSVGVIQDLVKQRKAGSSERVRELILEVYVDLPEEQVPNFKLLFQQLAQGKVPLVFNCSAGKDRTGIAAALVLSVLGVPREEVIADYMLTNHAIEGLAAILAQEPAYGDWVVEAPEAVYPLLRAEPEYLEQSFRMFEQKYGGVEGFVIQRLGITAEQIESIRDLLLD